MRAVRLSFLQMLACLGRDRMLAVACAAPVLAGGLFRFGIPFLEAELTEWLSVPAIIAPYYRLIDVFFGMLSPAMFCFASAMVSLEEADEGTAAYLFVTPLGRRGYLAARLGVPGAAAFLVTLVLLPAFRLTAFSAAALLLLAAAGALQGVIVALLILTVSSNKLEGMAVAKLSMLPVFGAAVPFFIEEDVQYVLFWLPSYWMGRAAWGDGLLSMVPAFALSGVWIWVLPRMYLRKKMNGS